MDDDDIDIERGEHKKHSITLQLLECLPELISSGISLSGNGNVFSVLCRPCNKCISNSNRAKLSNLQQHLNGKHHRNQVTKNLTNFEIRIDQKNWEKVSLDANGFLMYERENSGITIDKQPVESITEQGKEISLHNTSSVVSVNLSEIFFANTITPLKIGYICHACATILNPTTGWEIIVSHLKSTNHTKKLLNWNATHMKAKLLDIPPHLTPLFSENFLQHKENELYCISCSAHLKNVECLVLHTNSKNHTKKLDSFMQTISMVTILNLENDSASKHFQLSLSAAASCTLSPKSVETRESADLKPQLVLTSDELISLKKNHYIIGETLHCKICHVDLKTSPNIFPHINGKKHQTQLCEFKVKQEKLAKRPKKSSKPPTKDVIYDQSNPMMIPDKLKPLISQHLLQHLEKEIYCAACSAHLQSVESLIDHTNSKNHMAKLNLFMETISTATILDLEENSTSKDFQPSISAGPSCTLSLKSVKTLESTDSKLKLVENLYCKICRVDLQNSPNILQHINGKKHQTQLRTFKVKLQEKLAKPLKQSSKPPTRDSISDQPYHMIIPDELKPLISQHLLQHLEKEIYCAACSTHLQSVESLIDHTNSKNHMAKLNLFTQAISTVTIIDLEVDSTSKDFRPSSSAAASSKLSLESCIIGKDLHCKICRVDLKNSHNVLCHINGKNHKTQLRGFKFKLQEKHGKPPIKSNRTKAIDASTDACDNYLTASKNSENLLLQSSEHNHMDMNPIIKPINTGYDQKCLQQERSLLDTPTGSVNDDILATVSRSTSSTFAPATSTSSTSALISTSLAASSTPLICNLSTKGSISNQPNRMMIPDELKPLILQHLLQCSEEEIYCAACSDYLESVESLINHINSKNHEAELNLFMQAISTLTISDLEEDSTSKDLQPSSAAAASSKLSLESCIIGKDLHCKICRVDLKNSHNVLCHINGKNHKTQLRGFKSKLQEKHGKPPIKSNRTKAIDASTDACDNYLTASKNSENLLLQSSEHNLMDMNPIIKPINTEYDQKCLQQERSLLDTPTGSVNDDILATVSRSTSSTFAPATSTSSKSALISTSLAASSTPLICNLSTKGSISNQPNRMMIPDELKPLILQHLLQCSEEEIYCAACSDYLESVESLINHINSKNHEAELNLFMQAISTLTISDLEEDSTSKDLQPSSAAAASSKLSLESYIIGEDLYCKICRVNLQYSHNALLHMNGKMHNTQLHEFKVMLQEKLARPPDKINRTEATDASTDACNNYPTTSKTSEISLFQSSEHNNMDMNPIIKLINAEHDQKCLQQERSLLHTLTGSVNNDVHVTVPISTSTAFTIATSTSKSSALISTSIATPSTASLCNSSIEDSISDQPNLMEIPDKLKPLISKHFLQHLETEIYCDACSAHLRSAQSLVEHTKSRHHKLNLQSKSKHEKLKSKLNMIEEKLRQSKCLMSNHSLPDTNTPLKETNPSKDSRKADSNYSSIDTIEIYKVNPEKLRIIEMSCQLCFPKSPQTLYCLICEKSTSNNMQNFYDHMFSDLHSQYFSDLEANDLLYVDHPNQFSNLTLLKEFIMELTDETLQCVICDAQILDLDAEISVHIKQEKHIIEKRRLNKLSKEKFLKPLLQRTQSCHDNINIYRCELCDFSSDSAFAFAKHSTDPTDNACLEQRSSHERNPIYDSCVPCASLWLGFMNTYAQHCKKKSHKNNVLAYEIIEEITLPRKAIIYLKHAVEKVIDLIQLSDQVVTKEQCKVSNLLKCLEKAVKPVFPKAKAYPFGSRMSGLGFPESDIDVFLDCGTYFRTTVSEKDQDRIIDAVTSCLHRDKKSWNIEDVLTGGRIPIIKLYDQNTELRCDISFKNGLSVENTKLLKCFVDNCPMVRRLILFLKKWLAICKLSGSQYITNYALCWYVIFYLQSKTILPSVADLIRQGNKSKMVGGWETGISEKFVPRLQDHSFLSLLQGFFKYYAIFNFRKCVACPLLGYTVYKDDFEDLSSLPPEMAPYIDHLRVTVDHTQLFRIDSPMCIQDPYDLSHNLTKAVSKLDLAIFKQFCEASAEVLNSDFKMP